jgi:hypothetical protein
MELVGMDHDSALLCVVFLVLSTSWEQLRGRVLASCYVKVLGRRWFHLFSGSRRRVDEELGTLVRVRIYSLVMAK